MNIPGIFSTARRALVLTAALAALAPLTLHAYPDKPIRLVVPFAAGGGTDLWARLYATRLSARLGQPVVVDNRPGASTQVGANAVAKAEPDGHTLLFTTSTHIQLPPLVQNMQYDVVRDFAPVGQLGVTGLMFVVSPQVKAANMAEFIAQAKAAQKWSLGTYAAGSAGAVFSQAMVKDQGLDMPVVVYKGEAPAITDVAGGQIQGGFFSIPSVKALAQSGKVRPIANLSTARSPSFPEVPTLVELGLPRYRGPGVWLGVFAPARTPQPVLDKLAEATRAITQDREFQKEWAERDVVVNWRAPAEFQQDIRADMKTWADLVQALGIKPE